MIKMKNQGLNQNGGTPRILGIGTAVPENIIYQEDAKRFVETFFRNNFAGLDRYLESFDNTLIRARHLSQPLEWYGRNHTFAETMALHRHIALHLAEEATRKAFEESGIASGDVSALLFVTSTGISTPSLDAQLIQRLGISRHALRIPVWGLGCAGGISGLSMARELVMNNPEQVVLLVAVELCSLTFQNSDYSKSNFIACSLFSDGAAAVLLGSRRSGMEISSHHRTLFDDSDYVMGWDILETGFKVRFSKDIPEILQRNLEHLLEDACRHWGITRDRLYHYVLHPGGTKILEAYQRCLGLVNGKLDHSYEVLKNFGNMSSPTVLFVLDRFLFNTSPTGEYGIMMSFGPGFSSEQVLFKW